MFIGISENDGINPAHIINYDYTDAQPAGTDENGQPYAAIQSKIEIVTTEIKTEMHEDWQGNFRGIASRSVTLSYRGAQADAMLRKLSNLYTA